MRRLLVPVGLFLVIAALGLIFLPHDTLNPPRSENNGSSMILEVDSHTAAFSGNQIAEASNIRWTPIADTIAYERVQEQAAPVHSCEGQVMDKPRWVVTVPVATLWSEPNQARSIDRPSLGNPVQLKAWLQSMSLPDKLWLVGKLETQALLGTEVTLLDRRDDWLRVAVSGQNTPKNENGYPGWVPKDQLAEQTRQYDSCPIAVVSRPTAWLYEDASSMLRLEEISFNTELPIVFHEESRIGVVSRNEEIRWMNKSDVIVRDPSLDQGESKSQVTGEELVQTANSFLELPYLWAGTSGFGFDCSGFTYAVHRNHGITIPRDAKDQAKAGTEVNTDDLKPGDLLFYAYDKGKGKVHHVAMYIGEGMMIHSPKTERSIEIISMKTPAYAQEFAGARRYTELIT
ncbi:C40 family peptidase [Paenibacillus sp. UNC451MF]|uniref:C40 family peptidase n=1 Tax=Paenibacillus sp. UNC451MF TaxID=1449063 RepID=UPI00068D9BE3|nr:C40 family peptidase [Paenibacillus sp. UNC451MF]